LANRRDVINNSAGLILGSLDYREGKLNRVDGNVFAENTYGIILYSANNTIIHNNFINNSHHVLVPWFHKERVTPSKFLNIWDNGIEGNYWDNYTGVDADFNGIGDANYTIPADPYFLPNIDHYPLMGMFSNFSTTSELYVHTISNSSISGFQFNGTAISFNVFGENGTAGFCRICIPTGLMNTTYKIYVNGTETSYTLLPASNSTHSYLYFTYNHSTKEVIIIPEFPSLLILPLFIMATLLSAIVYRRHKPKH